MAKEAEAGTLQDLVLGEINHVEQEFSSYFVNMQTSSHVLSRTADFITRQFYNKKFSSGFTNMSFCSVRLRRY